MDGPGHLLSLKVMRVSRPSIANAWEPFYSSSPSFSAHSTTSILSLQGATPLLSHPKTLRDLTHASELLTLPSSFGAIQLGETFSSCLCVNNEANVDVDAVSLKVEMQTATSKTLLAEFGGPSYRLAVGDTLENVVSHEMKELGQHVLACTVSYRLPPNIRHAPGPADDPSDPSLQVFRKFYKFAVTNPLSVKTKVHTPRSPSALFSLAERDKIFLEVHIQNLTQEPMWFERVCFECTDGWQVDDANNLQTEEGNESIFSGPMALMQPQDMRQYIYILNPTSVPLVPPTHTPGTSIPLGRLDISWRSSFGEPGRLLTSMLTRRIPVPPVQPVASALPAYLKRTTGVTTAVPSRPRSPQLPQSRPSSPPPGQRPGSPFRRPSTVPPRTQSPSLGLSSNPALTASDIEATLVVRHIPRGSIRVQQPFQIQCTLVTSASIPNARRRTLTLAVQHLRSPKAIPALPAPTNPPEPFSPKLPSSGFSTPSSTTATFNVALAHQKLLRVLPRQSNTELGVETSYFDQTTPSEDVVILPPPCFETPIDPKSTKYSGATFSGSSALILPPLTVNPLSMKEDASGRAQLEQDFSLSYVAYRQGFITVGGLRVLLVEDKLETDEDTAPEQTDVVQRQTEVRTLKEWDVIAEIWVDA